MKLNAKAFALAAGVLWAAAILIWTLALSLTSMTVGTEFLGIFVNLYPWYELTVVGAFIGAAMSFVDAFIGCYVFAWLYNKFAK